MSIYDALNDKQREAVFCTEGPLLIMAGAGSGKTRALTHRAAYLIEEKGVDPWHILAITFTNKAASEMRERVDTLVSVGAESIWVSTFHSMCVRILRRHLNRMGMDNHFSIYDADDQKTLIKEVCRLLQIDTKKFKERSLLNVISHAKEELVTPEAFSLNAGGDFVEKKFAEVYREYEKQLAANNALDFDDLLFRTVQLFQAHGDVLDYYQERFRYIMVDEYQDTNTAQFELVRLLSAKYRNLCVVGDDDQSIYKFRGANIKNILSFETVFPDAKVVKLEQNYRSTENILNAANAVIANNKERKAKSLWTRNGEGEKLQFCQFETGYDEADFIASDICGQVKNGKARYADHAILYRTNAQSRAFEERFVKGNIPYKIIGGVNFYARREIKDILAYLKTVDNGCDDLSVRRIVNVPKRGIGLASVSKVQAYASERGIGFYDALKNAADIPDIGRGASRLEAFVALMERFKADAEELTVLELAKEILSGTAYTESLEEDPETAQERTENVEELLSKIAAYEEACKKQGAPATLGGFLEEVALVADIDSLDTESDYVVLMTLHSAKGLEFPHVYLTGLEDGMFPSYLTLAADNPEDLEEERRLCYVGITRAQKKLTLTCAKRRMVRGEPQYNKISRFLKEIPKELLEAGGPRRFAAEEENAVERIPAGRQAYQQAKQAFQAKAFHASKESPAKKFGKPKGTLFYGVGDRVRHRKLGEGTVAAITEGGRDYEVTIEFDSVGTRKMFAMFAGLEKV